MNQFYTAESVTEGHPDKLCDLIADSVLDECLSHDALSRVACEVLTTKGQIIVAGEITSLFEPDITQIAHSVLRKVGYEPSRFAVQCLIHKQSPDIAAGVNCSLEQRRNLGKNRSVQQLGAGDQGVMVGYACSETPQMMPLPVVLAHRLTSALTVARKSGMVQGLCPDGKAQVTVEYDEDGNPLRLDTIVLSAQHSPKKSSDELYKDMVLYAMPDNAKTAQFLAALGLSAADAYRTDGGNLYFTSDVLIDGLSGQLTTIESQTKNALEKFVKDNGGTDMPETDANGHSGKTGMEQGLYILVETYVPENVKDTTSPFLVSLPMTTIDADNWNYDVTVYPKNETGMPTLEKTLREDKVDTGKHNGTIDDITDGYAHTGTGSDGDIVDYQIISTLPTITSNATALTTYTFVDTLSKGIEYNKKDVQIEWFTDKACTDKIATWTEADNKFTVTYGTAANNATTMKIEMTDTGLSEINNSDAVYRRERRIRRQADHTFDL